MSFRIQSLAWWRSAGGLAAKLDPSAPLPASDAIGGRRDLRIDLIRGLCLWMILVDHLPGNPLQHITYGHFGLPDALDAFIFLSGISCALLYGKLLRTAGFIPAQKRALRRAVQLYVANLCIGLINIAVFFGYRRVLDAAYISDYDLSLLAHQPLRAIGAMAALLYTPQMMDVLPLYILLLSAAPALLLLMMRSSAAGLALSAAMWLAAAVVPRFTVPSLGDTGMAAYNPFSWQILFCIGLWLGKRHYIDGVPFRPKRWMMVLCWAVVAAGYIASLAARHPAWFSLDGAALRWAINTAIRTHIHPARLLNLLATAYLVAAYLRPGSRIAASQWTSPLRLCGRHSLEVFCVGIAVTIPGGVLLQPDNPLPLELVLTLGGFAAMTAVAQWLDGRRSDRVRTAGSRARPGARLETGSAQCAPTLDAAVSRRRESKP